MVTSLSPDLSPEQAKEILDQLGWSDRYPLALFSTNGDLVYSSARFQSLLKMDQSVLSRADIERAFDFKTEFDAGPRLLQRIVNDPLDEGFLSWVCDYQLKHYQLVVKAWSLGPKRKGRALLAKVLRSGDLLSDSASRQALFHTLSHEIRTSLLALKGHLQIAQESGPKDRELALGRMSAVLKRLDRVIDRMGELREELKP